MTKKPKPEPKQEAPQEWPDRFMGSPDDVIGPGHPAYPKKYEEATKAVKPETPKRRKLKTGD